MIVGALCAGIAVTCALLAARGSSAVERRLLALGVRRVRGNSLSDRVLLIRISGALAGAVVGCALAWVFGLGLVVVPVAAYGGNVVAGLAIDGRRSRERRVAESAMVTLVEWLHALVASGRPLESAVESLATRGSGNAMLDASLARVRRDYTLGVPLHAALAHHAGEDGIAGFAELASRVERSRELGRGALPMIEDLRDALRATERERALREASLVEGKLMLVLTLCYLPALVLLVVVPLFLTLLGGLFG